MNFISEDALRYRELMKVWHDQTAYINLSGINDHPTFYEIIENYSFEGKKR